MNDMIPTPDIVIRAQAVCQRLGFTRSCRPEVGRRLQRQAAAIERGQMLELGAGCGVGTAWLASGLQTETTTRLVTIDHDQTLAATVSALFSDWSAVTVLTGDWRQALSQGPFQLIFVDVSEAKNAGVDDVVGTLTEGGMVMIDDLTPVELWPEEWRGKPDPVRDAWLNYPDLASSEVRVASDHAMIVGTKIAPPNAESS